MALMWVPHPECPTGEIIIARGDSGTRWELGTLLSDNGVECELYSDPSGEPFMLGTEGECKAWAEGWEYAAHRARALGFTLPAL